MLLDSRTGSVDQLRQIPLAIIGLPFLPTKQWPTECGKKLTSLSMGERLITTEHGLILYGRYMMCICQRPHIPLPPDVATVPLINSSNPFAASPLTTLLVRPPCRRR